MRGGRGRCGLHWLAYPCSGAPAGRRLAEQQAAEAGRWGSWPRPAPCQSLLLELALLPLAAHKPNQFQALPMSLPPAADFDGSLPRAALRSILPADLRGAAARYDGGERPLPLGFRLIVAVNKADLLPKQVTPARLEVRGAAAQADAAAAGCCAGAAAWVAAAAKARVALGACWAVRRAPPRCCRPCPRCLPPPVPSRAPRSAGCASAWRRAACRAPLQCTSSAAPRARVCGSCWQTCRCVAFLCVVAGGFLWIAWGLLCSLALGGHSRLARLMLMP